MEMNIQLIFPKRKESFQNERQFDLTTLKSKVKEEIPESNGILRDEKV